MIKSPSDMAQRSSLIIGYEGPLEKNSGFMKTKTKIWCSLDGHIMNWAKENKRTSGFESLDLKDAQTVKKVGSDKTGTQFEIIMKKNKKNHVFTAPTPDECGTWIKKLQTSMISCESSPDSRSSSQFFLYDTGDYASLSAPDNTETTDKSTASKAEVEIKVTVSAPNGEYAEIGEVCMRNSVTTKNNASSKPDSLPSPKHCEKNGSTFYSKSSQCDPEPLYASAYDFSGIGSNEIYSDAASEGVKDNNPALLSPQACAGVPKIEVTDLYATVNKKREQSPSVEAMTDDAAELINVLKFTKPAPLILLEDEDYLPLREVKQFLANNQELCRYSHSLLQNGEDPIEEMKNILKDIR